MLLIYASINKKLIPWRESKLSVFITFSVILHYIEKVLSGDYGIKCIMPEWTILIYILLLRGELSRVSSIPVVLKTPFSKGNLLSKSKPVYF
jgi:hypothetical protein